MKKILAIGGAVTKTAWNELKQVCEEGLIESLIHNGGSIFHDFQRATEKISEECDSIKISEKVLSHSYPLDDLLNDYECNRPASDLVWKWIKTGIAPEGSVTDICNRNGIKVYIFTVLGADFWQLFDSRWELFVYRTKRDFGELCGRIRSDNFHFINLGSSVIMPEVFTKAIAVCGLKYLKNFRADAVDFLPNQYRPKTRVSRFGKYYHMTHEEFLGNWLKDEKFLDE